MSRASSWFSGHKPHNPIFTAARLVRLAATPLSVLVICLLATASTFAQWVIRVATRRWSR